MSAAFDGTWQRRGHQSLNGVVSCTSVDTGKVLDVCVLSKHCICLDKKNHNIKCKVNYTGSSGGMEVTGVQTLFSRSLEKHNVRYIHYLGDEDSAACKSIVDLKPYSDISVSKLECVGHIQKRMGSRLRTLKNKLKGKKLSDGLTLGGKNRVTYASIDTLQSYYGQAIRKNTSILKKMKQAVWATYLYKLSTDEHPQHALCLSDKDTWCGYNKAKLEGLQYSQTLCKCCSLKPPELKATSCHTSTSRIQPFLRVWRLRLCTIR